MGFLSSIYLWLIPLASLPVLIHLFFNKRYKLIEFSTVKFLKDLEVDSMRKVKLVEMLLLIIRTLIILFIIIMCSRPVIKSNTFGSYLSANDTIECVIGLDDSFSITRAVDHSYLKDIYDQNVKEIINTLPPKSHISIIKLSSGKVVFDGFKSEYDTSLLLGKTGDGNIDLLPTIKALENKNKKASKEFHLITDLQSYSFSKLDYNLLENWNVFIHKVDFIEDNLSIIAVEIDNDIITINKEIKIDVTIQNNGDVDAKNALIVLNIDKINVGQQLVDIKAGEKNIYSFFTVINSTGQHPASIDVSYDNLKGDNLFLFELNIPNSIEIGLLGDYSEDMMFVENSLKAYNQTYENVIIRYQGEILENENLLISNDVTFIFGYDYIVEKSIEQSISEALDNGGTFFIIPSQKDVARKIKTDFFDFIGFDYSELTFNSNTIELTANNILNDNFISILNGPSNNSNKEYMNLYNFFSFTPNNKSNILIDGMSIWNSYKIFNGNIHIIGFIPRLEWTDFPLKPSFLSWINYCTTQDLRNKTLMQEVGDTFIDINSSYTIVSPKLEMFKHIQEQTDVYTFSNQGIYTLDNEGLIKEIIVNPSYNELYYEQIGSEELTELFANIFIIPSNGSIREEIITNRFGVEIWKYFLYLSVFLIIIEMVISNQFFRRN